MSEDAKRIRLLKLWEILLRDTDEEHRLNTTTLLLKLREQGIACVRSTLYQDIKILRKFGYEIFCKRMKQNEYYVVERNISVPELLILMDAVHAASFISPDKTKELVSKLADLSGSERGRILEQNMVESITPKTPNNVLYTVSEISQAILRKKKIFFHYFNYDACCQRAYKMGKKNPEKKLGYKLNPLGTVFDNGHYYVFCYDDFFGSIAHYRIDRMDAVCMLEEDASAIANQKRGELAERKRKLFYMYGGEERRVECLADKGMIDIIYDKFGMDVKLHLIDDKKVSFSVDVQVSPTFLAWCCAFGNKLKITAPTDVVKQVQEYIQSIYASYQE